MELGIIPGDLQFTIYDLRLEGVLFVNHVARLNSDVNFLATI